MASPSSPTLSSTASSLPFATFNCKFTEKLDDKNYLVWLQQVELVLRAHRLQLNTKLKAIQTDWGGEFRPFKQFLADLGIVHRLICPHTHHQNGVVERKHRDIVEK